MAPSSGLFEKAQHRFKVVLRHICAALFTSGSLKIKIALKKIQIACKCTNKNEKDNKNKLKNSHFQVFLLQAIKNFKKTLLMITK